MDTADDVRPLADDMVALLQRSWQIEQPVRMLRAVVRLLSGGSPVTVPQIAAAAGIPIAVVHRVLHDLPDATWTPDGRLVGLVITSTATPYRLSIASGELYAASAIDAVLVASLLEQEARLSAACHVTGTPIQVELFPDGHVRAKPDTVLATVLAHPVRIEKLYVSVCPHHVLFRNARVAFHWLENHPNYRILTIREAYCYAMWLTSSVKP